MTNAAHYNVIWSTSRNSQMLDFLTCHHTTDALKVNMSLSRFLSRARTFLHLESYSLMLRSIVYSSPDDVLALQG